MNTAATAVNRLPFQRTVGDIVRLLHRLTPHVIAALTLGSGLLNIYSVIGPALPERTLFLQHFLPLEIMRYSRSVVLFTGFALVVLSVNIWRRKRRAWVLVSLFSAASVVLHLAKGMDYEEALCCALLVLLLWSAREAFTVRSRDIDPRAVMVRIAIVVSVAASYGVFGFWLLQPVEFGRNFNWKQSLVRTARLLTFDANSGLLPRTAYARWFLESLDLLSAGVLIYFGWSLFRPLAYRFRTHPADAQCARSIVERYGSTAQDFFKYASDKSFWFSEDRAAFLAYRVGADVAVVLGDPVGPGEQLEALAASFLAYCRDNGWRVVFHQATAVCLSLYRRLGLRSIKIGDEAIVRLDAFTLAGKQAKHLRSTLRQFEKSGVQSRLYRPPLTDEVLAQAESVSDEWLTIRGRRERQFSLGLFDREYIRHTELLAAEDTAGRMLGFVNLIPSCRAGEATLDLMRRRVSGPNGIMDYLVIHALLNARDRGFERFNLGMAPMNGFRPQEHAGREERQFTPFSRS